MANSVANGCNGPEPLADSPTVNGRSGIDNARAQRFYELALWLAVRQIPPRELSHGAKLCWDVIARFEKRGLECWAGLLRMAHEVGVTESQASRYMDELFKKKYAERGNGKTGKPVYRRLPNPDLQALADKAYQELTAGAAMKGGA